jgi:hypothetical protein
MAITSNEHHRLVAVRTGSALFRSVKDCTWILLAYWASDRVRSLLCVVGIAILFLAWASLSGLWVLILTLLMCVCTFSENTLLERRAQRLHAVAFRPCANLYHRLYRPQRQQNEFHSRGQRSLRTTPKKITRRCLQFKRR